jgi:hypothetical protein
MMNHHICYWYQMKSKIALKKPNNLQVQNFRHNACQTFLFRFRTENDRKKLSFVINSTKITKKAPKIVIFCSFLGKKVSKPNWPRSNFFITDEVKYYLLFCTRRSQIYLAPKTEIEKWSFFEKFLYIKF